MSPLAGKLTQRERVLRALRTSQARGITAVDFLLPGVIDGGEPITRVAARVEELRKEGYAIQNVGERHSCTIYVLASALEPVAPQPAPVAVTSLFDERVGRPSPSPYDAPDAA